MNTNKTELEMRPLEAHELDLVNGAGIPVQNPLTFTLSFMLFFGPPVHGDATWSLSFGGFEPVTSRAGVRNWADQVRREVG